ncbi:TonB-dependent vitamin B12 receptor BtuB [Methylosoma difficile]
MAADADKKTLEELLDTGLSTTPQNIESSAASKYSQRNATAPASLRIVTAEDIRTYGYRTLADVLRSLPGVYINSLRDYSYIGVRGFSRPGDYNSRVLLLIDGERINENIYDGAYVGNESLVDVDLVERVEFAPGAGSAVYGNNAFFGVINVITKRGSAINGVQVSGEYGSFDAFKGRGTYGKRFENGAEMLLSGTGFDRAGNERLYYKEFDRPTQNNGVAENLDYDRYQSAFAKFNYRAWQLQGGYVDRTRGIPTGAYESDLNDPHNKNIDIQTYVALSFDDAIGKDWRLNAHLGFHDYQYESTLGYHELYQVDYLEKANGRWWNGELRLQNTAIENHRLQFGVEVQDNFRQHQFNAYIPGPPYFDADTPSLRDGVFLQDEIQVFDTLNFTAGVRYDYNDFGGSSVNPRLALAWQALDSSVVKLIYGSAFRAPNAFELYYDYRRGSLKPEHIKSLELGFEHWLTASTCLSASLYHNWIDNLIDQMEQDDGYVTLVNVGKMTAEGVELEGEQRFTNGMKLSASYSLQQLEDNARNIDATNSPTHLVKLHFSSPLGYKDWTLGYESLYMSERLATMSSYVSDHIIGNLTVNGGVYRSLRVSLGAYNLFDQHYADPTGEGYEQNRIRQDGITFRLKLTAGF